jgi:hypothetical protein
MNMLVQLTNMENAGVVNSQGVLTRPISLPNYVTQGFLPVLDSEDLNANASNQTRAIDEAIDLISQQCPPASRKYIILATDGLATCLTEEYLASRGGCSSPTGTVCHSNEWHCRFNKGVCEPSLCGNHPGYAVFNETHALEYLLPKMQEAGIIFSVLFSGQGTRPHIKNMLNEAAGCDEDSLSSYDGASLTDCFLSFSQGVAQGKGGLSSAAIDATCDPAKSMFVCQSKTSTGVPGEQPIHHGQAYQQVIQSIPGAYYGRSLAIMAEVSGRTGGLMCPLTEPGATEDYVQFDSKYSELGCDCLFPHQNPKPECELAPPCRLKNAQRTPGAAEFRSIEYLTKGEQAAKCVLDTIGINQTFFVHPWKEVFYTPSS